jgi:preprotein translocase subunit SecG
MLRVILTIVQVFSCLAIIGLVLLQKGKGAEAGAGFGAGASGTVFGARGATTALSRATAIFVAIFMLNSLLLTYMGTHSVAATQPKSILDTAAEKSGNQGANKPTLTIPVPSGAGAAATTVPPPSVPASGTGATPAPGPTSAPDGGSNAATQSPSASSQAAPSGSGAPASAPSQPAPQTGTQPNGAAPK